METLTLQDLQFFLPEVILITFAFVVLFISNKNKSSLLPFHLAMGALLGALIFTITQLGSEAI